MGSYWTAERLRMWRELTPLQRDHDRYVGCYPPGQGTYETGTPGPDDDPVESACTCHVNPPCSRCTEEVA